jgi:hypothetical protein
MAKTAVADIEKLRRKLRLLVYGMTSRFNQKRDVSRIVLTIAIEGYHPGRLCSANTCNQSLALTAGLEVTSYF